MQQWIGAHTYTLLFLWCLAGVLLGAVTLMVALRRRSVPAGLFSALIAVTVSELVVFPDNYFYTAALQTMRFLTIFLALDLMLVSILFRLQRRTAAAEKTPVPEVPAVHVNEIPAKE